jgi:transmembrane sensor
MSTDNLESMRWITRLDGQESAADRAAFARWLAEPENATAHARSDRFWRDDLGQLAGDPEFERMSTQALAGNPPAAVLSLRSPVSWAIAASLGVGVLVAGAFVAGHYYVPTRTYITEDGQRSTIVLEDGSQVTLNSATQLTVKMTDERRQFRLKEGEAVFAVAEDMQRPFTVLAGDGAVTALGTRFQVRNEMEQVTVTLLQGRIAVDRENRGQHLQLNPGDQVKFTHSQLKLAQRTVDPRTADSWTRGHLEFKVTALAEVLDEVNRYSRVKLRLSDRGLAEIPVSGAFELGDGASVVAALQGMLPVETTAHGENEIVLSRRKDAK